PCGRQGVAIKAIGIALAKADNVASKGKGHDLAPSIGENLVGAHRPSENFVECGGLIAFPEQGVVSSQQAHTAGTAACGWPRRWSLDWRRYGGKLHDDSSIPTNHCGRGL